MNYNLPEAVQERIRRELDPGESVRWADQPVPALFTKMSLPMFLFAIPWTAFAVFWICGASGFKMPDFRAGGFAFFPLFGVPFVLVGLWMLTAPVREYLKMRRQVYVVTGKRAMILGDEIRSFYPDRLKACVRTERRNGLGDILFTEEVGAYGRRGEAVMRPVGFMNIREPCEVERLIRTVGQ